MGLRKHGVGGRLRIEVQPMDRLPKGVPGEPVKARPEDFDERGRFAQGNTLSRLGGQAKAGQVKLAHRLGIKDVPPDGAFAPYKRWAVSFKRAQCNSLKVSVGNGECGPGPQSLVASAALQLAWSRYYSDIASLSPCPDPDTVLKASRFADASRQNLLAAHELCAREAASRPQAAEDPLAGFMVPVVKDRN